MNENLIGSPGHETPAWQDTTLSPVMRAQALIEQLTLDEKAAQLGSFWPQESDDGGDVAPMQHAFSAGHQPFSAAISDGLGHLTRVFGSAPVTPAEGMTRLRSMQAMITSASRFNIGAIAHEECLTGLTTLGATVYPAPLAWGATFDPELVGGMAGTIGRDMSSMGIHQGLSPVLDVVRDYRWGRVEETIGEDPYLVATIGTAYVRGLQSAGVMATLKHFAGYSASQAARNHAPVAIGRRELLDVLLQPFEMAVREGPARSVMNSYADLDGVPPAASRELLTTLLREEWGFSGTVVSDYWAVTFLELMHHVAADPADAAGLALTAGLDIELPETRAYRHLAELVREGRLSPADLDTAASRVLTQKAELGLLDAAPSTRITPACPEEPIDLDPPSNRALAREIAEKSVVVLANNGVLPLAPDTRQVAVIGPSAQEPRTLLGCYSFPNHVLSRYEEHGTGVQVPTIWESLQRELPAAEVSAARGCEVTGTDRSGIPHAVTVARDADVAVVTVGDLAGLFGRGTSGEGCDAADLSLPGVQGELVQSVLATGVPVILVVVSGRPYALGAYADRCAAVVQTFFPGEEGGPAVSGVLAGRVNPSGRLPVGIPRRSGGQPSTYRVAPLGQHSAGISNLDPTPLYPFGHGLSYTDVAYTDLALSSRDIGTDGTVEMSATVRNTGTRACAEVVQVYLSDHVAQVARPVRELIGYARVPLAAGQACRVTFTIHAERTSFTGLGYRRVVEPGEFTLALGRSSADLVLTCELTVTGDTRVLDRERVMTTPVRTETVHEYREGERS